MASLPRLHWSTLGAPTQGLEHRWAAAWALTLDRGATPALPPEDADLWAITAEGAEPPPALARAMAEVGALPIVLLRSQPLDLATVLTWSALGSVRWAPVGEDAPRPGLRPLASHHAPLTAAQALGLGLVGLGPGMQQVLAKARAAAATKATVLLNGESGTGKEVVARAIHRMSAEADGPF
ncbi:MAG TPA: sigma 54-interacting transcriptional regulator, partial [Holophaga sp.]|nr:sigma 54-interacting transcriptional regulator [Holophaga sp.]